MLKVGGSIVYTSTTLSQPQNDGVIQSALQHFVETDMNFMIHDLSGLVSKFNKYFWFYRKSKYGQLVLPYPSANFGPVYFCKLTRTR